MILYARIATPLGPLIATAVEGALTATHFEDSRHAPDITRDWVEAPRALALSECARQLAEYFSGTRQHFELSLLARGTPFQERIWHEIARIPFGETTTYAALAARSGKAGAARAAGAATGRNPLSILIPCHRVVGSSGTLTGYAGGVERKARLLALEGAGAMMRAA